MPIACPRCEVTLSDVIATRQAQDAVYRRRRCFNNHVYTTVEQVADMPLRPRELLQAGKSVDEVVALTGRTRDHVIRLLKEST